MGLSDYQVKHLVVSDEGVRNPNQMAERVALFDESGVRLSIPSEAELNGRFGSGVAGPVPPYDPSTKPVYLDQYWRFFRGIGFTSGSTFAGSTVATQPSTGASTLVLADATGIVNGQLLCVARGTAQQQVCIVSSVSTNTVTFLGRNRANWAIGTEVSTVWANDTHPLDSPGYTALAYWLANLTHDQVPQTGTVLFASGEMASTYTDANGEANCPVGWESFGSSGVSFIATSWGATNTPHARRTPGAYVAGTSSGDGVRTLTSIPVQPGQVINVSGILKSTGGSPVLSVVDKNATSTVLGSFGVGGTSNVLEGQTNNSAGVALIEFVVPAGVRDIEVRITQSTASAMQCYFDDIRVMVVDRPNVGASSRYLLEDLSRPIVWLGDSWGEILHSRIETMLVARSGGSVDVVDAATTGERLDQMVDRIATDVLPHRPRYCIVNYGMNDLSASRSQANMEADVDELIVTLRAQGIKPIILGIPPMTSQWSTSNDRNDQIRARVMLHTV